MDLISCCECSSGKTKYLCLTKDQVAVAVGCFVDIGRCNDEQNLITRALGVLKPDERTTHVLWASEGDPCDAVDLFQPKSQQRFPRLSLSARLDFVEGSGRRRILIVVMVVVVVVVVIRMIAGDLFNCCRHLKCQSAIHLIPLAIELQTRTAPNTSQDSPFYEDFWMESIELVVLNDDQTTKQR